VETLWQVGEVATGGLHPDLTVVLDMDVAAAQRRLNRAPDRMEAQGLDYLQRVRQGYLTEVQLDHENIIVINADRHLDVVQTDIQTALASWMDKR
jgi:dTMP kinase